MSTATAQPVKLSWYVSVAVVLFLFVVVGVYSVRMSHETSGYDDEQAKIRLDTLHKLQAADRKTLTTADWIDKDKGVVRIPIDEAVVQEVPLLQAKPLTMGTAIPSAPVANTIPAPAAAAPAPATNAAPAGNPTTPSASGAPSGSSPAPATNAAPTGAAPTTPPPSK